MLVVWALIIVISVKYMLFILRANNHGEGGIFALLALLRPDLSEDRLPRQALILLGLFGAGLLYGGTMLTPAISVLSAVEGLSKTTTVFDPFVVPLTVVILFLLAGRVDPGRRVPGRRGLARREVGVDAQDRAPLAGLEPELGVEPPER